MVVKFKIAHQLNLGLFCHYRTPPWLNLGYQDSPTIAASVYAHVSAVPLCYRCRVQKTGKARRMKSLSVVIGAHQLSENEPSQKRLQLTQVIINKGFLRHRPAYDLALLKLDSNIEFTREVSPICVDRSRFPDYTDCYATGWRKRSVNGLYVTTFSLSF